MDKPLRVITLWQPWASLVIAGVKPFEFRGKRPPSTILDERVVIHAARRPVDQQECIAMLRTLERGGADARDLCLHNNDRARDVLAIGAILHRDAVGALPLGCGLGTAIIGEARDGIEVAETVFGADTVDVGVLQSNWAWPLNSIRRWVAPVPAKGKQGIWFWPYADVEEGVAVE